MALPEPSLAASTMFSGRVVCRKIITCAYLCLKTLVVEIIVNFVIIIRGKITCSKLHINQYSIYSQCVLVNFNNRIQKASDCLARAFLNIKKLDNFA